MENGTTQENYVLTFPIINKHLHESRLYKAMKYITIIIAVISLILLAIKYAQNLGALYTKLDNNIIFTTIFIFLIFFIITTFIRFTLKRFDYNGLVKMQKDNFIIESNNFENTFYLNELKNFTIILNYSSFSPNMFEILMFGTWIYWFGFFTGTGNFIQFHYKDTYYRYEIYLQSVSQINLFKTRINYWHQNHYPVRTISD
jgi:hypothetical protein